MRTLGAIGLIMVAAATVGAVATRIPTDIAPETAIILGAAMGIGGIFLGIARSRRLNGRIDPLHPLILPVAYLTFSFLAPTWAYFVQSKQLLGFSSTAMDHNTPELMLIATCGAVVGLAIPFRRHQPTAVPTDPTVTTHLGRLMLMVPLALNLYNVATGSVATRGIGQTTRTGLTSLSVLASLLIPIGMLLLLNSNATRGPLLRTGDWILVLALAGGSALAGGRNGAITITLCLLYAYTRRSNYRKAVIAGVLASVLAFSVVISTYRTVQRGIQANPDASRVDAVLTDLSVAAYSTGITARGVPSTEPFRHGATYADALVRQLPSGLANRAFGPPVTTGNETFRRLIGTNNPNQGWGYSLPAEGYLNFGVLGLFFACFFWGAFAAWAYTRHQWPATRTLGFVYAFLIATMPIAIRSDAVGMIKTVLYPVLAVALALALSRSGRYFDQGKSTPAPVRPGSQPVGRPVTSRSATSPHRPSSFRARRTPAS